MVDGTDLEIDGLDRAEGPLDAGKALVGGDGIGGGDSLLGDRRANDVEAVERGFLGDVAHFAHGGEAGIGDVDLEVLGHLVATEHLADGDADLVLAPQGPTRAPRGRGDLGEGALGCLEKLAALAGALVGKERIAADDEPLAGKVRRGNLRHVALVEERELQAAGRDEGADRSVAQRRDPFQPGRLEHRFDLL